MSKTNKIAAGLLVLGLVGALAWSHPKGRWRLDTLALKAGGNLPEYSWSQVLSAQLPAGTHDSAELAGGLVSGMSVFSHREPDGPCPVVFDTPLGAIHARIVDDNLLESLLIEQVNEQMYNQAEAHVSEGDVVIDGGAHVGTFTLSALKSGASRVIAFEPEPTNADCLRQTFKDQIAEGRVVLKQAAMWHSAAVLSFSSDSGGHESARGKVTDTGNLEVQALTLDGVVEELGLDRVDFIKMDIEGAERDALRGSRRTLERFSPEMALCVYHRSDDPTVVPEVVLEIQPEYRTTSSATQVYFYR